MEKEKLCFSVGTLEKLCDKFYEDFDQHRYAEGWNYRCSKCHRLCTSVSTWFPCRNEFLTTKIKCLFCGSTWKLNIDCEKPNVIQ